jgi:hypothetical protein
MEAQSVTVEIPPGMVGQESLQNGIHPCDGSLIAQL